MQIKVSIIVTLHNVEKFLDKCIQSVLSQTFREFELILINNGSTDGSGAICERYQKQDSRIVYFPQKDMGMCAARNRGIDAARGEFITILDGDDWLDSSFLEKMLAAQERYNSDLTSCEHADGGVRSKTFHAGKVFPGERYAEGEDFFTNVVPRIFYNDGGQPLCDPYCHLFKKEILDPYNIRYDERLKLREGRLLNFEYAQHCSRFYYLPEPLYYRILRSGSESHLYRENIYQESKDVCTVYMELLQRYGQSDQKNVHFCIDVLINLIFYSNLKYPENIRTGREMRKEYYAFLSESPMKEFWEQVRISQCRDIREVIEVVCIKLHMTTLLKWIYWLRMEWTNRKRKQLP